MAQEYYTINGAKIKQPLELMPFQFATTYTEDTTRTQDGVLHSTPLFTVESYSYNVTGLSATEMAKFLQLVGKDKNFNFHYFSPYYGTWHTDKFYIGQGSLQIRRVNTNAEYFDSMDESYKADQEYSSSLLFPVRMDEALRDCCAGCGITLYSDDIHNKDFIIKKKPEGISFRDFIGDCAMIAGGNAVMDNYNRLKIIT